MFIVRKLKDIDRIFLKSDKLKINYEINMIFLLQNLLR